MCFVLTIFHSVLVEESMRCLCFSGYSVACIPIKNHRHLIANRIEIQQIQSKHADKTEIYRCEKFQQKNCHIEYWIIIIIIISNCIDQCILVNVIRDSIVKTKTKKSVQINPKLNRKFVLNKTIWRVFCFVCTSGSFKYFHVASSNFCLWIQYHFLQSFLFHAHNSSHKITYTH